jgi:hypothetical protein
MLPEAAIKGVQLALVTIQDETQITPATLPVVAVTLLCMFVGLPDNSATTPRTVDNPVTIGITGPLGVKDPLIILL